MSRKSQFDGAGMVGSPCSYPWMSCGTFISRMTPGECVEHFRERFFARGCGATRSMEVRSVTSVARGRRLTSSRCASFRMTMLLRSMSGCVRWRAAKTFRPRAADSRGARAQMSQECLPRHGHGKGRSALPLGKADCLKLQPGWFFGAGAPCALICSAVSLASCWIFGTSSFMRSCISDMVFFIASGSFTITACPAGLL